MRYQGRVSEWNDDRGFGFLVPNGGGNKVFAHISAFPPGVPRPSLNELVTYELGQDKQGKSCAVQIRYVSRDSVSTRAAIRRQSATKSISGKQFLIAMVLVAGLASIAWSRFSAHAQVDGGVVLPAQLVGNEVDRVDQLMDKHRTVGFSCDGRDSCSQMTSCEEAQYFLAHCPFPKMDGDGDGIPCEQQWCH